jgi:hypothetical protein
LQPRCDLAGTTGASRLQIAPTITAGIGIFAAKHWSVSVAVIAPSEAVWKFLYQRLTRPSLAFRMPNAAQNGDVRLLTTTQTAQGQAL